MYIYIYICINIYVYICIYIGNEANGGGGNKKKEWYCKTCTYYHDELDQQDYMSCAMCGSERVR
jgi:Zn finger protein HypA/HybF involved in hydrogenase expression